MLTCWALRAGITLLNKNSLFYLFWLMILVIVCVLGSHKGIILLCLFRLMIFIRGE